MTETDFIMTRGGKYSRGGIYGALNKCLSDDVYHCRWHLSSDLTQIQTYSYADGEDGVHLFTFTNPVTEEQLDAAAFILTLVFG